jgi:ankyrin repeat protein
VILLLVDRGANVALPDTEGNTGLHFAAREGHHQILEVLINNGADVNAVNKVLKEKEREGCNTAHMWVFRIIDGSSVILPLLPKQPGYGHPDSSCC